MSVVGARIRELGLVLPAPLQLPPGAILPFPMVNIRGRQAFVSGHGPLEDDGAVSAPFGKLGAEVSVEEGYVLARKTGLAILASLETALGDLDRIAGWSKILGMVNSAPGFQAQPAVINGFTDLIIEVFGTEKGQHARSAVGMAELPFNIAVEIEAEVLID